MQCKMATASVVNVISFCEHCGPHHCITSNMLVRSINN